MFRAIRRHHVGYCKSLLRWQGSRSSGLVCTKQTEAPSVIKHNIRMRCCASTSRALLLPGESQVATTDKFVPSLAPTRPSTLRRLPRVFRTYATNTNANDLNDSEITETSYEDQLYSPPPNAVQPLTGGLYVVGTPIGNLEDISLRALRVLEGAKLILAEDTRRTGRLLKHYNIHTPLLSYFEHNEQHRVQEVTMHLQTGSAVALVSDAGMPTVSDPGSVIISAAAELGVPVVPVPGPCAAVAGLVAAGLPAYRFTFVGFLPDKSSARKKQLHEYATQLPTLILYVAPHDLVKSLKDAAEVLGAERRCCVAREMTKLHEEFWRGSLQDALAEFSARTVKGEITLLIEGADKALKEAEETITDDMLSEEVMHLMTEHNMSPSAAARKVSEDMQMPKRRVYNIAVRMSGNRAATRDGDQDSG